MSDPAKRGLRILHLSDALFEEVPGGSRQVARELIRAQKSAGHEPVLLTGRQKTGDPGDWQDSENGRVVQYAKGSNPAEWVRNGREACARLLAEGDSFDVLHTHFAYAAVGPLEAAQHRIAHVRSFYGPWDAEGFLEDKGAVRAAPSLQKPFLYARALLKRHFRHGVEAANLRAAARTIILSEQSRGEVLAFGYDNARIVKSPGGVNRDRFFVDATDTGARTAARIRTGLPPDAFPLLLSIRRLAARMGLENLVAALPAIRATFPRAHLVIGGRGPLAETLAAQARRLGVAEAVSFAGFIPDLQVADYYRAADGFVLPTLALEGFGLVTLESLACGTPVIATPVGAIPEVLGGLDERLLAKGTDSMALTTAILAYCAARSEPGGWANALSAARLAEYVDARYTWERHAETVEAAYRAAM